MLDDVTRAQARNRCSHVFLAECASLRVKEGDVGKGGTDGNAGQHPVIIRYLQGHCGAPATAGLRQIRALADQSSTQKRGGGAGDCGLGVSRGFDKFTVQPKKIAVIFAMSSEVVRANPLNYINVMREKVGEAFAVAFDNAVLHGDSTPFGAYVDQTKKTVDLTSPDAYGATNNALKLLVNDGKKFTGGLLDNVTEPVINDALDKNGRPLFIEPTYTDTNSLTRTGRILARPITIAEGVKGSGKDAPAGYFGDFSKILWGQVGGISYDISDQATLDLSEAQDGSGMTSLWQNNLVAVRAEAEFAALVRDPEAFVKVTTGKGGSDSNVAA